MNARLIFGVLRRRSRLRTHLRWNRASIELHQQARLRQLRDFAHRHSAFYRRFHTGLTDQPLDKLPILTKSMLMEHFDELVTDPRIHLQSVQMHLDHLRNDDLFLNEYRVTRTAGSTGNPGIFLSSKAEWADIIASYARAQEWAGIHAGLTHRARLAVVSSRVPSHQSARVGASVDSPFIPVRRFDATEPLQEIVAGLSTWQPDNLIAYASMARTLAQEQLDGRLNISPKAVMSASEVLSEEARSLIRAAWGCEPFNVYAATETAGIASECQHHRMHLFEDLVITEIVDEENRPVPMGEFGAKLLVTVLFSRTQPLIRYEISDRVMPSPEMCDCGIGFKLIDGIEGRAEDILELPSRNGGIVRIHPNVFHNVLESQPLKAWQVLEEPDRLRVLLVPTGNIDLDRIGSDVQFVLQEQGALDPMVKVERVPAVLKTATGKAPLIRARKRSADS